MFWSKQFKSYGYDDSNWRWFFRNFHSMSQMKTYYSPNLQCAISSAPLQSAKINVKDQETPLFNTICSFHLNTETSSIFRNNNKSLTINTFQLHFEYRWTFPLIFFSLFLLCWLSRIHKKLTNFTQYRSNSKNSPNEKLKYKKRIKKKKLRKI